MNNFFYKLICLINVVFLVSCLEDNSTKALSSTSEDNIIPKSVIVDKNGNLGIWTLTPATLLHVQNQDGNYGSMMLGGNTSSNNHFMTHETDGSFNIYDGIFGLGVNRFRIESNGFVGIDTLSPTNKFVVSNSGASGLEVNPAGGVSSGPAIIAYNRSGVAFMPLASYGLAHTWFTGASGSTRAVDIDSSGNVGVGASVPTSKLTVAGVIETTSGGIKFPDGTTQVSAAPPIGSILTMMTATCPTGYLAADGAAVLRATYASLFSALAVMYGPGDGSTTFNLPDLRGYFLRGVSGASGNDPDAATRTNRGDGTSGNSVGTLQTDAYRSHSHTQQGNTQIYGGPSLIAMAGDGSAGGTTGGTTSASGGNETRPKNINVLYCIKY